MHLNYIFKKRGKNDSLLTDSFCRESFFYKKNKQAIIYVYPLKKRLAVPVNNWPHFCKI